MSQRLLWILTSSFAVHKGSLRLGRGISLEREVLRMIPHVDVAIGLAACVAGPVVAKAGKGPFAKVAGPPVGLLALANQRSFCTGWAAGRSGRRRMLSTSTSCPSGWTVTSDGSLSFSLNPDCMVMNADFGFKRR